MTSAPIIARGLVRHFGSGDNTVRAVDGVDLQVNQGEIFGFLGPNGAGKSTTFRMIVGLHTIDAGSITFLGRDITRLPMHGTWPARTMGGTEGSATPNFTPEGPSLVTGAFRPEKPDRLS